MARTFPRRAGGEIPATLAMGVRETYDFERTPTRAMDAVLEVHVEG